MDAIDEAAEVERQARGVCKRWLASAVDGTQGVDKKAV